MKTRIQDLDDTTFKELMSDKLRKGYLCEDKSCEESNSKIRKQCDSSPPKLTREYFIHSENIKKPFEITENVSRDQIKKSCKCAQCENSHKSDKIITRFFSKAEEKCISEEKPKVCNSPGYFKNINRNVRYDPYDKRTFKCDICNQRYDKYDSLVQHRKVHNSYQTNITFECNDCGQKFWSEHYLIAHRNSQHGDGCSLKCHVCGAGFRWEANLAQHLKSHQEEMYTCDLCGEIFFGKNLFKEHMNVHTKKDMHECLECKEQFSDDVALQTHLRSHISDKYPYVCVICGHGFHLEKNLEDHVLTHIGIYPYKCYHCGAGFNHDNHLKEHVAIHAGFNTHKCQICSKSFYTEKALETHTQTHNKEQGYKCFICRASFTNFDLLSKHLIIHNRFTCMKCGQCFRCQSSLVSHEKEHIHGTGSYSFPETDTESSSTDETLGYGCDLCSKKFSDKHELQEHFLTHGESSYGSKNKRRTLSFDCLICHKKFRKARTLKMHILTHKSAQIITCRCQLCGKGFAQLRNLKNHIASNHPTDVQCDLCDKKFEFEKELEGHILIHFEKDKSLAIDVSNEVNQNLQHSTPLYPEQESDMSTDEVTQRLQHSSPLNSEKDMSITNATQSTEYKDLNHDSALLSDNENILHTKPFQSNEIPLLTETTEIYPKEEKEIDVKKTLKHVQFDTSTFTQQQYQEDGFDLDSVHSPLAESVTFSPRTRLFGSDTDSGYSDKHVFATSDSEGVYSPRYSSSERIHIGANNENEIHNDVVKLNEFKRAKLDTDNEFNSDVDTMLENNLNFSMSSASDIFNPFLFQENIHTAKYSQKLSRDEKQFTSKSSTTSTRIAGPIHDEDEIVSHVSDFVSKSESKLSLQPTPRVPFLFPGKRPKLHHGNHINFRLLGRLK